MSGAPISEYQQTWVFHLPQLAKQARVVNHVETDWFVLDPGGRVDVMNVKVEDLGTQLIDDCVHYVVVDAEALGSRAVGGFDLGREFFVLDHDPRRECSPRRGGRSRG